VLGALDEGYYDDAGEEDIIGDDDGLGDGSNKQKRSLKIKIFLFCKVIGIQFLIWNEKTVIIFSLLAVKTKIGGLARIGL
jgi:hypothetical protein